MFIFKTFITYILCGVILLYTDDGRETEGEDVDETVEVNMTGETFLVSLLLDLFC
jgi:hypothetical protein